MRTRSNTDRKAAKSPPISEMSQGFTGNPGDVVLVTLGLEGTVVLVASSIKIAGGIVMSRCLEAVLIFVESRS